MKQTNYNLGLASVSFRRHAPAEILAAMQHAGLTHIEWGSDIHAPCTDKARLAQLATLQAQYGISCSSYGTYFRLGETPLAELTEYILAAKQLGTDVLRLWCGQKSGACMTAQERAHLVRQCQGAAAIAAQQSVTLCMECHKNTFTEHPADAVWLMREIASPHFRMYWQPFQWQCPAENVENARTLAPYVEHVHVFFWRDKEKLPLADAVADWRSYLAQLSAPRILLLEFMPKDTLDELAAEAAALKQIAGEKL